MSVESQRVGPVSLSERIQFIDVLRGMALFGILAANMRAFFAPLDAYGQTNLLYPGHADIIAQGFINIFIQGKFISTFSFLFGLGFAMQMSRAQARGAKFLGFYPRRLFALALFGIIHGLFIWAGDILLTYAFSGAILLLFRNRQQKTLLWWAAGLFSLPIVVSSVFLGIYFTRFRPHWMEPKAPDVKKWYDIINIYAHGTVRQMMAQNWVEWKHSLPSVLFSIYATALFLLGMWVWRAGILQHFEDYRPVFKRICAVCIPLGLAMSTYSAVVFVVTPPTTVSLYAWAAGIMWLPGSHILAAGYITVLALLFMDPKWQQRLHPFAAVGRMALTDYLMQSVVCTLFFYHYTTGLYGRVGPAIGLIATVVLYSAQVGFSNWWLTRYRFGPMEWVWRGLTYGKFPSMHKDEPTLTLEGASLLAAAPEAEGGSEEERMLTAHSDKFGT